MIFPKHIFEDIKGSDFSKHNKKQVTEDFVAQNFVECGWNAYTPFNDTGIDIIVTKKVCPNKHTKHAQKTFGQTVCKECDRNLIEIKRFIQVKTREIKDNETSGKDMFFGYTLKSKDFRTDPRHIFLFYSDATNEFLILPMYEYMKFFFDNRDMAKSHFGRPSFRKGNNKLNNLNRTIHHDWIWKSRHDKVNFNKFVNQMGLLLLSNVEYDLNLDNYVSEISEMKLELFYTYSRGKQVKKKADEDKINDLLKQQREGTNVDVICNSRGKIKTKLKSDLDDTLKESINKYWIKFKNLEAL